MADSKTSQAERIARIEATLEILKDSSRGIQEEVKVMNQTLAVNTKQLEIHIQGVKLAREQNDLLRKEFGERLTPVEDHVKFINTSVSFWSKAIALFVGLPACVYYCINIYLKLKGQ